MKTYRELCALDSLEKRFNYLQLNGFVAGVTFGSDRYLNQQFYRSKEWKQLRNKIIVRDYGGELGLEDYPISGPIYIHHMNPLSESDLLLEVGSRLDEDQLISCSLLMHNAIHYGDDSIIGNYDFGIRTPNDTKLW